MARNVKLIVVPTVITKTVMPRMEYVFYVKKDFMDHFVH